jgi:hypothetical protein
MAKSLPEKEYERTQNERKPDSDKRAITEIPQGVTKRFKGRQDKDSSQISPKETEVSQVTAIKCKIVMVSAS